MSASASEDSGGVLSEGADLASETRSLSHQKHIAPPAPARSRTSSRVEVRFMFNGITGCRWCTQGCVHHRGCNCRPEGVCARGGGNLSAETRSPVHTDPCTGGADGA